MKQTNELMWLMWLLQQCATYDWQGLSYRQYAIKY